MCFFHKHDCKLLIYNIMEKSECVENLVGWAGRSEAQRLMVDVVLFVGLRFAQPNRDCCATALRLPATRTLLGHVMGMTTVAELVETDATIEKLRTIGVDFARGYAIGEPAPLQQQLRSFQS